MGRKTRRNNTNPIYLKIVKFVVIGMVIIFTGFLLFRATASAIVDADQFKVRKISLDQSISFIQSTELSRLKGKSIFKVDLKRLQERLRADYPQVSRLKVIRRFPNEIYVYAKKRNAFALAKVRNTDVTIDEGGVVLSFGDSQDRARLPYITGLRPKNFQPNPGEPIPGHEIRVALTILQGYKENSVFSGYPVDEIDVGNLSKIIVSVSSGFKIILDRDKISARLKMFELLLSKGLIKTEEINYVDLRFKEPVVRKK